MLAHANMRHSALAELAEALAQLSGTCYHYSRFGSEDETYSRSEKAEAAGLLLELFAGAWIEDWKSKIEADIAAGLAYTDEKELQKAAANRPFLLSARHTSPQHHRPAQLRQPNRALLAKYSYHFASVIHRANPVSPRQ